MRVTTLSIRPSLFQLIRKAIILIVIDNIINKAYEKNYY